MNVLSIDVDWAISSLHQHLLAKLFYSKLHDTKNVYFGNRHNTILSVITKEHKINLANIDHHHDICYTQQQNNYIKENLADEGCWLGLLLYNNRISNLNWIRNAESDSIPAESLPENYLDMFKPPISVDYTLDHLYNIEYDMIFVCRSDEYTGGRYRGFYDTLMTSSKMMYPEKTAEIKLELDISSTVINYNNADKVYNEHKL